MLTVFLILGATLAVFLTLVATLAQDPQPVSEIIRARRQEFVAAVRDRNVERALSLIAADGTLLAEGADLVEGRKAIRLLAQRLVDRRWRSLFRMETLRIEHDGGLAYEVGVHAEDGESGTRHGKYLDVWRREPDGAWRIVVHAPSRVPGEAER